MSKQPAAMKDDDDDSHDGIGLENSSLQDL